LTLAKTNSQLQKLEGTHPTGAIGRLCLCAVM